MEKRYTDEKNVQIILALLKAHGINQVIASPGSANSPFVASVQYDSYFKVISVVDERSAAYMACGWAHESGKPVVISCTGATASRNYLPGMTEAFYRKLPIIAVTSTHPIHRVGHHVAQVIDRSSQPNDTYSLSVTLPVIKDARDQEECEIKVNNALLQIYRAVGGPAHIDLQTSSLQTYRTKVLPNVRKISHYNDSSLVPEIKAGKVAIFMGSHRAFNQYEIDAIEEFCVAYNGAVFCDHTSQYHGKYRILAPLVGAQHQMDLATIKPDLTIHLGEVSGDYYGTKLIGKDIWRVSSDGILRDTFGGLTKVFEMSTRSFFDNYVKLKEVRENDSNNGLSNSEYFDACEKVQDRIRNKIPELPFSNLWAASQLAGGIPRNSTIHFGILNSLRSWNFFDLDPSVKTASNVGGFGIDGCFSSLLGASLNDCNNPYFCVIGDLAFFYDLNAIGNRHLRGNIRILLVNNGLGTEFKTYKHHTSHFGDSADEFICAAGHFGRKSRTLVRNLAIDLGFDYLCASSKEEFSQVSDRFLDGDTQCKPIIFEIFTDSNEECNALEKIMNIEVDRKVKSKGILKGVAKDIVGDRGLDVIRRMRQKKD